MSAQTPPFLKLHLESSLPPEPTDLTGFGGADDLARAFQSVTGWQLRSGSGSDAAQVETSIGTRGPIQLQVESPAIEENDPPALDRTAADELATAIAGLVNELDQTQSQLRERDAELAAGVPVVQHSEEQMHLAQRLEAVLKAGAQAVEADAIALYLLNDDTSELTLRSSWGLGPQHYLDSTRSLRGAMADLEALLGHAVVIEDTGKLPSWNAPLDFESAACVPVSSPTTLLGTLWTFGTEPRDFTEHQTNTLEIIAGRIAADLEREALLQQGIEARNNDRLLSRAADWQQQRLPTIAPQLDDWQVAGWALPAETVGRDFYDWNVVADGRLAVMLGEGHGRSIDAGLISAVLHTATRAHAAHSHDARQLLERVNETLWTTSSGSQGASLFYALLDPEPGTFEYATAGKVAALLWGPRSCDVIEQDCPVLGVDLEPFLFRGQGRMEAGDSLILLSEGVHGASDAPDRPTPLAAIASYLKGRSATSAEAVIDLVKAFIDSYDRARVSLDQTILVVRRN